MLAMLNWITYKKGRNHRLEDTFKVLDKHSTNFVTVLELKHIFTSSCKKLDPFELDKCIREKLEPSELKRSGLAVFLRIDENYKFKRFAEWVVVLMGENTKRTFDATPLSSTSSLFEAVGCPK
ncbi:hypothetical protein GBA52_020329 [Prunus armeniaca]|nr:hypothetical protein GBA52_020329 [Prunus armeniaca]